MDSKAASVGRAPRNNRPGAPPWPLKGSGSETTLASNAKRKRKRMARKAEEKEFEAKLEAHKAALSSSNDDIMAPKNAPDSTPKNSKNNRQNKRKRTDNEDIKDIGAQMRQIESEESEADDKDAVVKKLANQRKNAPPSTPGQSANAMKKSESNKNTPKGNDRTIYTPAKSTAAKQKATPNKANGVKTPSKAEESTSGGLTKKQQDEAKELVALQEVSSSTHFQRYFAVSTVFTGHLDDSRPMFAEAEGEKSYWQYTSGGIRRPEDKQVCSCCTEEGHLAAKCPKLKCSYCSAWNDHFSSGCPKKPESGKKESLMDIWRTLPTYQQKLLRPVKCIPVSCYLCASESHLGDDCPRWSSPIDGAYSVKTLKNSGVLDKNWDYKQEGSHKLLAEAPLPDGGVLPEYLVNVDPELGSQPHEEFDRRSSNNNNNNRNGGGGGSGGGYNRNNNDRSYGGSNRGSGGGRQDYRKPWRSSDRSGGGGGYRGGRR
ncbi:hypothetical protein BJ508DRAFT_411003 [Ascobolus immersus RN42]|uniref:CCHC-type domain-containing protein n=1 Tax=Ascobolus immersus RN42 TaxID=1160509 RepID=A0A3N4IN28_ASCIM|nr:hypothetical protein BJ508DRAFT_411003 [Ascobolus immersus RN42]